MELEVWENTMNNVFKTIHARHNESKKRHEAHRHHRRHTGEVLHLPSLPSLGAGGAQKKPKSYIHHAHNPDNVYGHGKDAHVHGEWGEGGGGTREGLRASIPCRATRPAHPATPAPHSTRTTSQTLLRWWTRVLLHGW